MKPTKPSGKMLLHDHLSDAAIDIDLALTWMIRAREGMTRPALKIHDERTARLQALRDELTSDAQRGMRNEVSRARIIRAVKR